MDPVILTIILRSVAAFLLIFGGYLQIRYGYKLYANEAGIQADESSFEVGNIKLRPRTVGSVVMSTAFLWAFCSLWAIPTYEKTPEWQKVFSLRNPDIDLTIPVLLSKKIGNLNKLKDELVVLQAYRNAIENAKSSKTEPISLKIDNKPVEIKLGSYTTNKKGKEIEEIVQEIKTSKGNLSLKFKPEIKGRKLIFVPEDVKILNKSQMVKEIGEKQIPK